MLNDDLLLDSARPVRADSNNNAFHPEETSPGVPSSCMILKRRLEREKYKWYVLRVSYSRELKVLKQLEDMGVRAFVPMKWTETEVNGAKTKKLVPAVNNLCFVHWSFKSIMDFMQFHCDSSSVHFYWDRTTSEYLVVPDAAMDNFIKVAKEIDSDIIYLNDVSSKFRQGQKVTVMSGPFEGVTGKIVRVRKSRRILVEIPGVLAVATAYVNPEYLRLADVE